MELSWLKPVVDAGSVASVHLDVTRTTLDADRGLALRWAHLERGLAARGCPTELVASLAERALEPSGSGGEQGRHIVARPDSTVLDLVVPGRPRADVADWGPAPLLLPLVRALDPMVDYVLVEVDHVGADSHVIGRLAGEPSPMRRARGRSTLCCSSISPPPRTTRPASVRDSSSSAATHWP